MLKVFFLIIGTVFLLPNCYSRDSLAATFKLFDPDCHQNGNPSATKAETVTDCNEEMIYSIDGICGTPCILDQLGILEEVDYSYGPGYSIRPEKAISEMSPSKYGTRYGDHDTFVPAVARGVHKHCNSSFDASIPLQGADCKAWEPFMSCVTKVINCELK